MSWLECSQTVALECLPFLVCGIDSLSIPLQSSHTYMQSYDGHQCYVQYRNLRGE